VSGLAATLYVLGACVGALLFGQLTDRFGRKRLFMITLGLYLSATVLTALAFSPLWFFVFRFLTGMGIGGEYSAINSAIDELIPAEHRGRVDISVNGTYWAGAIGGALLAVVALNTSIFPIDVGWRLCFAGSLGLEDPESLAFAERLVEAAARYLPLEQLALSPQCGFASVDEGNLLTPEEQRRKLELVVDTARKVWG